MDENVQVKDGESDLAKRLEQIDELTKQVEGLRQVSTRQELAIRVMRERIFELELEVVNARCALAEMEHSH